MFRPPNNYIWRSQCGALMQSARTNSRAVWSAAKMATSFDKLEKFFSVAKRRDRFGHGKSESMEKVVFPSPSYMQPKAMNMKPRLETSLNQKQTRQNSIRGEKMRSHSVPTVEHQARTRPAKPESRLARPNRSRPTSMALDQETEDESTKQKLDNFRFPEDSLFRRAGSVLADREGSCPVPVSPKKPQKTPGHASFDAGLLDWSPKHISLLFNSQEPPNLPVNPGPAVQDDTAEPFVLQPSPPSSPDASTPTPDAPLVGVPCDSPRRSHTSTRASSARISLFPKPDASPRAPTPLIHSPPLSDSEESFQTTRMSSSTFSTASDCTPTTVPDLGASADTEDKAAVRPSPRTSWAIKLHDPTLGVAEVVEESQPVLPRSRLRKTQSAATLSVVVSKLVMERVLSEPTLHDIYSLTDEDIAESPPAPSASEPPPPPPKDDVDLPVIPQDGAGAAVPVGANRELTPAEDAGQPRSLIPMQPSQSAGALGAIMAAGIARKYNFDMVYLVSLWPKRLGTDSDPAKAIKCPLDQERAGGLIMAHPKSATTGRFLAAFGLNDLEEPFRIYTKVHLKILQYKEWLEYERASSEPDKISRGWMHSFNCGTTTGSEKEGTGPMSRGVIFAAYVKQKSASAIPHKGSKERKLLLQDLYTDAKNLVDTLTECI